MENIKNKRISVLIILSSTILLLYCFMTKDYDPFESPETVYFTDNHIKVPLEYYFVNIIGLHISFKLMVLFLLTVLGFGIYLFMYKNDTYFDKLKNRLKLREGEKLSSKDRHGILNRLNSSETKLFILYSIIGIGLLFLMIGLFYYSNYINEQKLVRPLSAFESIYISYLGTFFKVLFIVFIIKGLIWLSKK